MDEKRRECGQKLLDAAHDYWEACRSEGQPGAVQWLIGTDGDMVIFTRGEYRHQLMANIDKLSENESIHYFGESIGQEDDE